MLRRDRAETAERAARESAGNIAAQRVEHARLDAELRQEFRNTSDRQTALIDKVRLDLAQSVSASKELENHLGAARALSESLSREIDRLMGEANQLKADLAAARTEIETSNREVREVARALHSVEIEGTRLRTVLHAKEEALQVERARRVAADNALAELRSQLKSPSKRINTFLIHFNACAGAQFDIDSSIRTAANLRADNFTVLLYDIPEFYWAFRN